MLKRKTNPVLVDTIRALRRAGAANEAPVWQYVAKALSRPARSWAAVNVGHMERVCDEGSFVVVPGKVLGAGFLEKTIDVAAWGFSESAREKIVQAGGRCLTIDDALEEKPDGSGISVVRQ